MLTPNDIRNPKRKSGFDRVERDVRDIAHPFRTTVRLSSTPNRFWHGPRRATADEAAQDYCDYVNGTVVPERVQKPSKPPKVTVDLNHAGHRGTPGARRTPRKPRRGRKALTLGYVYCIAEEGSRSAVKIGYAKTPTLRIGTLQTGNPRLLVILGVIRGTLADEREIHAEFQNDNILGEWFRPSPELLSVFSIDPEVMA